MPPSAWNGTESAALQKDSSEHTAGEQSVIQSHLSIPRSSKVILINQKLRKNPTGMGPATTGKVTLFAGDLLQLARNVYISSAPSPFQR